MKKKRRKTTTHVINKLEGGAENQDTENADEGRGCEEAEERKRRHEWTEIKTRREGNEEERKRRCLRKRARLSARRAPCLIKSVSARLSARLTGLSSLFSCRLIFSFNFLFFLFFSVFLLPPLFFFFFILFFEDSCFDFSWSLSRKSQRERDTFQK